MSISRKNNTSEKILWAWSILLSIVLLVVQSTQLHIHDFDHAQDQQQNYNFIVADVEHATLTEAHSSIDNSHSDHHAEISLEIDTSPNALLKKSSIKVLTLALLITLLLFLIPSFCRLLLPRLPRNTAHSPRRFIFSPPLRAPPL